MSVFILEDDIIQGRYLETLIKEYLFQSSESIYLHTKIDQIIERILIKDDHNIYFLDINLKKNSVGGLEAASKIRELDKLGIIVFISSHAELAFKSYKYLINAYTFIDKNEDLITFKNEVYNSINFYISNKFNKKDSEVVIFNTKSNIINIKLTNVYYFESIGMHRIALKGNGIYKEFYGSLKEIEQKNTSLVRVHHSFIVNLGNSHTIDKKSKNIVMITEEKVPISRKYYCKVCSLFK